MGLLIALGTGPTAVAYTLYFRGLGQRLSATGIVGAATLVAAVLVTVRDASGAASERRVVS